LFFSLQIWDLEKGFCKKSILTFSTCNDVSLLSDGQTIVSGHFDGAVRFWDLRNGQQVQEMAAVHERELISVDAGAVEGVTSSNQSVFLISYCIGVGFHELHYAVFW
jgi:WD40 repeat protein